MEPEWLKKARAAGQITEKGVNIDALTGATSRGVPLAMDYATEAEFQEEVIRFAQAQGWRVAHCRKVLVKMGERTHWETPMLADGKGFLDLEVVRERLVKIELKFGKNTTTPEQKEWIAAYERAGIEVYVWYPADWPTIKLTLKEYRGKGKQEAGEAQDRSAEEAAQEDRAEERPVPLAGQVEQQGGVRATRPEAEDAPKRGGHPRSPKARRRKG